MINKFTGATLILLAVVSLIASWMIYKKYTKNFYVSSSNSQVSRQLIRDMEIKPESYQSLVVMQNVIDKLSKQEIIKDEAVSIALSPVTNIDDRPIVTIPTDLEKQKRRAIEICRQARNLNVSMSFVSDSEEYAVIADKFVRIGQVMDNKFEVLDIKTDKVKVQKEGVKCDINVSSSVISQL